MIGSKVERPPRGLQNHLRGRSLAFADTIFADVAADVDKIEAAVVAVVGATRLSLRGSISPVNFAHRIWPSGVARAALFVCAATTLRSRTRAAPGTFPSRARKLFYGAAFSADFHGGCWVG